MDADAQTYAIIGAAMEVHQELGPGYLEAVYQEALALELSLRSVPTVEQPRLRIEYKGHELKRFYMPDFVCFDSVVVEIKAHASALTRANGKQILNSMKCGDVDAGLLFNFGRPSLDFKRFVR